MSKENFKFQAEVGKILNIVANSLYSEKEIFVREYIWVSSKYKTKKYWRL